MVFAPANEGLRAEFTAVVESEGIRQPAKRRPR